MSKKIAIICATFYQEISQQLQQSAESVLDQANFEYEYIEVPGCFEIPSALSMAIQSNLYQGAITLGCVIRGETTHYDYVCEESARGINQLAIDRNFPVGYGIITAENQEQANARADKSRKDVGGRAAQACLAMIELKNDLLS
jgi:6,7-dimethyl-8-ribityllumazine synthase